MSMHVDALRPPILSFPFVLRSAEYILTSLKAVTINILQNLCHFQAVLLFVLSHSSKMLLGNLGADQCQQIPRRNHAAGERERKKTLPQ